MAVECPTKLYYLDKEDYTNQSLEDSFLGALAKGGFQVGEFANANIREVSKFKTSFNRKNPRKHFSERIKTKHSLNKFISTVIPKDFIGVILTNFIEWRKCNSYRKEIYDYKGKIYKIETIVNNKKDYKNLINKNNEEKMRV